MIIDIHSHIGDPWYAYWKQNVDVEDHLVSMDKWGIDKRCVSWWQAHNAPDKGNKAIAEVVRKYPDRFLGFAAVVDVETAALEDDTGFREEPLCLLVAFRALDVINIIAEM